MESKVKDEARVQFNKRLVWEHEGLIQSCIICLYEAALGCA